jgi:hypothetical protein
MKSTGSSTTNLLPFSAGASKPCPHCGGTVRFKQHYPVLTGRLPRRVALSRNDTNETERLRYVKAWVCETGTCAYWEVVSEASTNAAKR